MSRVNVDQNSPVNVGLVGFGMAGRVFHAPLIHANPNLRLSHIVQRHGDEAKALYPNAQIVRDVDDLLKIPEVELVVVATPNSTHFQIAASALQAEKHVVVDKPFTITTEDADKLISLSCASGLVLSVFQNRRWDGDFLTVQQILGQKLVGRLVDYESRFDRYRPKVKVGAWREKPEPGSGLLYDIGAHLIDQAVLLFGPPEGIYAETHKLRDGAESVDNFQVHLEYPGLKVVLKAGVLVCEPSPRFVLHGPEGSYVKYGLDPQEDALKQGRVPGEPGWGAEPESSWGTLTRCMFEPGRKTYPTLPGCYQEYYRNVYGAIRGKEELAVKPEQSREVIRLIELAAQSAREKRVMTYNSPRFIKPTA